MRFLLVYSSRTGNTRKVAEAVFEALPEPKEFYPVEEAPRADEYDFVLLGFWVDKGNADEKAANYLEGIKNKKIFLFGTLGAYPDSEHARNCLEKVKKTSQENDILGTFLCQGKVDPDLLKWMNENLKNDPRHSLTPERKEMLREAEKHPDVDDLTEAGNMVREALKKLGLKVENV